MFDLIFLKKTSYAQYLQDLFIDIVFFHKKKKGFFIDIGAYDGVKFSNSYYFEKYKNWDGIVVEPNKLVFSKLTINRKCKKINAAITDKDAELDYMRINGNGEMLSGIVLNFAEKHKERIEKNNEKYGNSFVIEKVKSIDINTLIENFKVEIIDFLSIDIEGGELELLKKFPFHKIQPKIILVENNYKSTEFESFLSQFGYCFVFRLGDDIYTNEPITNKERIKIWIFRILKKMRFYKLGY